MTETCPNCGTVLTCPSCSHHIPTPTELRVLEELCADGAPTPVIAERLGIRESTVKTHLQNLMKKFDTHSRTELVIKALKSGTVMWGESDAI